VPGSIQVKLKVALRSGFSSGQDKNKPGMVTCKTVLLITKLDPVLNSACRAITGCLKPTNVENLYLLGGVAPPYIRKTVASQHENLKQENDPRHPLFNHIIRNKRLKSRHSFLHCVNALDPNLTAGEYPRGKITSQENQTS